VGFSFPGGQPSKRGLLKPELKKGRGGTKSDPRVGGGAKHGDIGLATRGVRGGEETNGNPEIQEKKKGGGRGGDNSGAVQDRTTGQKKDGGH